MATRRQNIGRGATQQQVACASFMQRRAGLDHGLFWRQNYAQECYQGDHITLVWAVGIPGLVLLALGWPAFCAVWIHLNKDRLYVDQRFNEL